MKRVLVLSAIVFAQLQTSVGIAGSQSSLKSLSATVQVREDGRFEEGVPRALYNVGYKLRGATTEQTADAFMSTLRTRTGIENTSITFSRTKTTKAPGGTHFRYTQKYLGIPIFRGDVVISLDDENMVGIVVNNAIDDIAIEATTPALSPIDAITSAQSFLNIDDHAIGGSDAASLVIYPMEAGEARLAYRVTLTRESGDWEVFSDAFTGEVLHHEDRFVSFSRRVQGSGYVYISDPVSAARKFYNSYGFTDGNDADTDSLSFYRTLVTLDSLTYEDGLYKLKGPYVNVTDIESPADPPYFTAVLPDSFRYTRSQQEFEAVNVYYHCTETYKRLLKLGFENEALTQLRVDPHGFQGEDNSHYSPNGNWIGMGEGGVDDAEDADVIWHEYGHAINYSFVPTWGGGESGALGEGYSDYWAASYSRSLNQWQTGDMQNDWIFNWDGHNPFWMGRILNDSRSYPFNGLPIHSAGQVWNSALMGIWGDLGRDITDRLVLKSLLYLGSHATAADAANAIIQADRDLYEGNHLPVLVYWLGTVKKFLVPANYLPLISHTPPEGSQNPFAPIEIYANISSQAGLNLNKLRVMWGPRSLENYTVLVPTQNAGEFVATLPPLGRADTLWYYITATDLNGATATYPVNVPVNFNVLEIGSPTIVDATQEKPLNFALAQNYPNPFNPATSIRFDVPEQSSVSIVIYDMLGREVTTLVNSEHPAGAYSIAWKGTDRNGSQVSSGTYYYRIEGRSSIGSTTFSDVKKMIMLR
ncbi:MAG TPA: FlgD immunoglobulin-like domain containing protein [Bacteroidota bacterium]